MEENLENGSEKIVKGKSKNKIENNKNVTDNFTKSIKKYLDELSMVDAYFKEKYDNPDKNIIECCAYIVNQVTKLKVIGLDDGEVYALARHYYLEEIPEEDLKLVYHPNRVISNHQYELTEEEKQLARETAAEEYKNKVLKEMEEKTKKDAIKLKKDNKAKLEEDKKIKSENANLQLSFDFDFLDNSESI